MANETAKVVRFHTLGGPEVLKIQEEPIPEPGKGEVRLNVKAIGLNRAGAKGARVIFDSIAGKGIELLAQAAAVGGTIFKYGALAPGPTLFPLFTALSKGLSVRGYTLREILKTLRVAGLPPDSSAQ